MISDKISMNYLDSFIEEDREMYEMLADEHIKKIEQHKKIDKKSWKDVENFKKLCM